MAELPDARPDMMRPRSPGSPKTSLTVRPAQDRSGPADASAGLREQAAAEREALRELRELLVTPEQQELSRLRRRLAHLERPTGLAAEQVSHLLPEAVVLSAHADDQLAKALAPTIEETLKVAVRRDPGPVADAIFPVIGPAIRRSINEALSSIKAAVDRALEHSFSIRSLKWRLEANRTGVSFAEVVLRHTLLYRVEHLFLIDRDNGLPLQHVGATASTLPEADDDGQLFSAMLTAIQDFVRDSLGTSEEETLATMQVGEMAVWIEPGPHAYLAAVIRGVPDPALRNVLKEVIETVHLECAPALGEGETEPEAYKEARPILETGLLAQYREREKKRSPTFWFFGVLLLAALVAWAIFAWRGYQRDQAWRAYLEELRAEPGLVVTDYERDGSRYVVQGLRDPLAADPDGLPGLRALPEGLVVTRWEPYQALDPALVERRARRLLDAPPTVTLRYEEGRLSATGSASRTWIDASGARAPFIAGVDAFDASGVQADERLRLRALTERVERVRLRFELGTVGLSPEQADAVANLADQVQTLRAVAADLGGTATLRVTGHASSEGTEALNRQVSRRRAEVVRTALLRQGVPAEAVEANGSTLPLREERTEADRAYNRSVTFEVITEGL